MLCVERANFAPRRPIHKAMATGTRRPFVAVVDDDVGMREATEALLNSAGFRTSAYSSAEAFLRSRRARKADGLVLDMRLPGITGLQLYRKLREQGLAVPTVLLTADRDRGGRLHTEASAAGILAVLYKPYDGDTLVNLVQAAFEKQSS